jgi:uncharacterized repeat protein (TIGR03803 family)
MTSSKIVCSLARVAALLFFFSTIAINSPAQTFTSLFSFDYTNGAYPYGALLVQGLNGNLYGVTSGGGIGSCDTGGCGTIFELTPTGTLTTLYTFCKKIECSDGSYPVEGLMQASNGNFYGSTYYGGVEDSGTLYEVTPSGTLATLYSGFCPNCAQGWSPDSSLIQMPNGNLYGATELGGTGLSGVFFELTLNGEYSVFYNFTNGNAPNGSLFPADNGGIYAAGGDDVYEITLQGNIQTIYGFCAVEKCRDGEGPSAPVQAANGNLYGTTVLGGVNLNCEQIGCGTVYELTPQGALTRLYSFCAQPNCTDGSYPEGPLVLGTDGNFYGVTHSGGANGAGTIFQITPAGVLTTLHSFDTTDGAGPYVGLIQATNGKFYGTTYAGGSSANCSDGCGTIFGLSMGLGPFVALQQVSAPIGGQITILGNNLTGATAVNFNGTPAVYTVISDTSISAVVPAGATGGTVQVSTAAGNVLSSNVPFRVAP